MRTENPAARRAAGFRILSYSIWGEPARFCRHILPWRCIAMKHYEYHSGGMQATLMGECHFPHISGQVRFSCLDSGVILQAHVCGLPGGCPDTQSLFGLILSEDCHCPRRISLPVLTAYGGQALLSAHIPGITLQELRGRQLALTSDPCSRGCERVLARGQIVPCGRPSCCFPDQRPLFAPLHRSPGESIFY